MALRGNSDTYTSGQFSSYNHFKVLFFSTFHSCQFYELLSIPLSLPLSCCQSYLFIVTFLQTTYFYLQPSPLTSLLPDSFTQLRPYIISLTSFLGPSTLHGHHTSATCCRLGFATSSHVRWPCKLELYSIPPCHRYPYKYAFNFSYHPSAFLCVLSFPSTCTVNFPKADFPTPCWSNHMPKYLKTSSNSISSSQILHLSPLFFPPSPHHFSLLFKLP